MTGFLFAVPAAQLSAAEPKAEGAAPTEVSETGSDGVVQTKPLALPFSSLATPEARAAWVRQMRQTGAPGADIGAMRAATEVEARRLMALANSRYRVSSQKSVIDQVRVDTFTPAEGVASENRNRVLIELHGGGFLVGGGGSMGAAESIPIAALGRIKVIAVDYRQAPEHNFPSASEDVAKVYRFLLKTYPAENIGIYGCSAGGILAGEAVAWFQKNDLPVPGAIGIFCASARPFFSGDSGQLWPDLVSGRNTRPPNGPAFPYFAGTDPANPLVTPAASKDVLRKFPPTLFLTGTRSTEMSGAARSHTDLLSLGVKSQLLLFDGLSHGFVVDSSLPESREAYDLIVRFFDENLGHGDSRRGEK